MMDNNTIYQLILSGSSYRAVAESSGISHGRVRQIFFNSARADGLVGCLRDIRAAAKMRGEK